MLKSIINSICVILNEKCVFLITVSLFLNSFHKMVLQFPTRLIDFIAVFLLHFIMVRLYIKISADFCFRGCLPNQQSLWSSV